MRDQKLATVCEAASCPNRHECWGLHHTATFLLLGETCTRACAFCGVASGRPGPLDPGEPRRVAETVAALGLRFAVITSVTRDDLSDGGAAHFAATIRAIHALNPGCGVEALVPDFRGNPEALAEVLAAGPRVLNHNLETVRRLQPLVRPKADCDRSLALLGRAAAHRDSGAPDLRVKSGLMLGLGERPEEVLDLMQEWRAVSVDIATLGQYLPPTAGHPPPARYVTPEEFEGYRAEGLAMGFRRVESGPLVRSSYHARESSEASGRQL